jgi:hypothetical protein
MHLSGETEPRGALLENLVLGDLLARRDVQAPRARATSAAGMHSSINS